MEDFLVIQSILQSVSLDFNQNEQELQKKVDRLPSNSIIRLKNLLEFNKSRVSLETFKKYSKFLNDLLRVRRMNLELMEFSYFLNEFDENVKPNESKVQVVDGISLWALSLLQAQVKNQVPEMVVRVEGIIKRRDIALVASGFFMVKAFGIRQERKGKVLKRALANFLKRELREFHLFFQRIKKKVQEKTRMRIIHQRYIEEFQMKNKKVEVKERKSQWPGFLFVVFVALLLFKCVLGILG
jgi:hypothetical protein